MANEHVNKVVYGGNTLIDLTEDTVTPATLSRGVTAHNAAGQQIVGENNGGSERFIINVECTLDEFDSGIVDITLQTGDFADALDSLIAGQDVALQLAVVEEVPGEDPIVTDGFLIPLTYVAGSETELSGTTTVRFGELLYTVSVNLFDDDTAVVVCASTDKLIVSGEMRELADGDEAELSGLWIPQGLTISQLKTSIGAYGISAIDDVSIDFWMLTDALNAKTPIYLSTSSGNTSIFMPASAIQANENMIVLSGISSMFYLTFRVDVAFINDNNDNMHVVAIQYAQQGGFTS